MDGKTIIGLLNNYVHLFYINRRTFTDRLLIEVLPQKYFFNRRAFTGLLFIEKLCIGLLMGEFLDTL